MHLACGIAHARDTTKVLVQIYSRTVLMQVAIRNGYGVACLGYGFP